MSVAIGYTLGRVYTLSMLGSLLFRQKGQGWTEDHSASRAGHVTAGGTSFLPVLGVAVHKRNTTTPAITLDGRMIGSPLEPDPVRSRRERRGRRVRPRERESTRSSPRLAGL